MTNLLEDHPLLLFILAKMAFPFMFFATGIMCLLLESFQNVIPGHPILSFLVLECGAMVLTHLITLLTLIGAAFSALCCMFILSSVFTIITDSIELDSLQYFILLTVIFSVISLPLCFLNLIFDGGRWSIPGLSCIVAGIMNALTAALYILAIRNAWVVYRLPQGGFVVEDKIVNDSILGEFVTSPSGFASVPGAVMFYIVFAVICLGAFVATIIFREKLDQLSKEFAYEILQGR